MKDAKGHGSAAHQTGIDQAVVPAAGQIVSTRSIVNTAPTDITNGPTTDNYRAMIRSGQRTNPVLLIPHESPGKFYILDGYHRLAAHNAEGKHNIEAYIKPRGA